jgi:hypothetical protein
LVEQKKAQLVVVAHDVDPIEVCVHFFLPPPLPLVDVILKCFMKKTTKNFSGFP